MSMRWLAAAWAVVLALAGGARAAEWAAVVSPDNSFSGLFAQDGKPVMAMEMMAWGPNWAWAGSPESKGKAVDGVLKIGGQLTLAGEKVMVRCEAKKTGERVVTYTYELEAGKEIPITMVEQGLMVKEGVAGEIVATDKDGKDTTLPIPQRRAGEVDGVAKLTLKLKDAGDIVVTMDPPCDVHPEGGVTRMMLAHKTVAAGKSMVTIAMAFPGAVTFVGSKEEQEKYTKVLPDQDWFAFKGSNDVGPSVIGFDSWLDKPAGKHGGVQIKGSQFVFADGTPVKFFGSNLAYGGQCCPDAKGADLTAARFAKWGVNCVRLHKFCGPGWEGIGDPQDGTKLTPAGLERLDYFTGKLTENGVYYGFSHTYGFHVRPGDKGRLLAYDEIMKADKDGNTYGLINFAEDVQDVMIDMVVGLLKHQNPHTGKTYAEDPCLAWVELQNEDDIFFFTTQGVLDNHPTYRKNLEGRFADWLKAKYTDQAGLEKAWGGSLKKAETLEARNIGIQGNPWFMGPGLPKGEGGARTRALDNAAFLHECQDKFYGKFVKAIRAAGYKGPLCGSPWQAAEGLPHYYNLLSDYQVGWIDRHNYFGGGLNATMLTNPGSGYLGSGLQQVIDRPFGISEWIHVYPSLYSAEGPAIYAAYGMGLQGWSASYEFQSASSRAWGDIVGAPPFGVWNADCPTQIGQYPVLARMIARGDVKEGQIISVRRVYEGDMAAGKFDFSDTIQQTGDIKVFGGTVPAEALAAGRVVVEFHGKEEGSKKPGSTFPDMKLYDKDKVITSETGQLVWDYSGKGFFTVNTDGTKAVVGFAEGKECTLGNVKMKLDCPYASVFITAAGKGETLANAKTALVSAVARNANSGFKVLTFDNRTLDNGKAPVMLEPVKATIAITGREIAAVNILDHDGKRVDGKTVEVKSGAFALDGTRDQALYYEVVFK